ncbi:MAG: hypothetical protein HY237_06280 [Acidobacteria bacterium]|nr:hypothetical protein [Acidobacteriota bacterium]
MLRKTLGTLLFSLLVCAACSAQTGFQGLVPGQSTQDETVRVLGPPVRTITAEVLEFSPQAGTGKIEVEVRKGSGVVERIEVHFLEPIVRSALLEQLSLPASPEVQRTNKEGKLVEYYGGSALLALTYASSEASSGVASLGYYSRELFENAASGSRADPGAGFGATNPQTGAEQPTGPSPADSGRSWAVPAGTVLLMQMKSSLTSKTAHVGETISAMVSRGISLEGQLVIPAGSVVEGRVTQVTPAKRMSKPGVIAVDFDSLVFGNGSRVKFVGALTAANAADRVVLDNEGRVEPGSGKRAAIFIGGGAAAGAAVGAISGGGKGAGIGAGAGAAEGVAAVMIAKGPEAEIPSGLPFGIELTRPLLVKESHLSRDKTQ